MKRGRLFPFDIFHLGFLIKQCQHAFAGGKRLVQVVRKARKSHHRTERTHDGDRRDDHGREPYGPYAELEDGDGKRRNREELDGGVGHRALRRLYAGKPLLQPTKRTRALVDGTAAHGALPVLDRFVQAVQRLEDEAVHPGERFAEREADLRAATAVRDRDKNAHHRVACKGDQRDGRALRRDERRHAGGDDDGDRDGRYRMGVEDLEQLDVGGDERNEIALVASLELRGAECPQHGEDAVTDDGEQAECDEVVAILLAVVQKPARHRHDGEGDEEYRDADGSCDGHIDQSLGGKRCPRKSAFETGRDAEGGQNRDEDGAQVADRSQDDGQHHDGHQRLDQDDEATHNGRARAARRRCVQVVHATTSCVENRSSAIC